MERHTLIDEMGGWVDGWLDGWTSGRRVVGRIDGWVDERVLITDLELSAVLIEMSLMDG
jgi:hypothetical protein